jgi:hypothetical protein
MNFENGSSGESVPRWMASAKAAAVKIFMIEAISKRVCSSISERAGLPVVSGGDDASAF